LNAKISAIIKKIKNFWRFTEKRGGVDKKTQIIFVITPLKLPLCPKKHKKI